MATTDKDTGAESDPKVAATDSEVQESPNASKRVSTVWPVGSFSVQDCPEITMAGTGLTATQLKKVEKAAQESDVKLVVEDVK